MNRREFLKTTSLAAMACCLPVAVLARETSPSSLLWGRTLILLELNGGNDGINTVIPYRDNDYYRLRPNIAIDRDKVLQLDEKTALHPAMKSMLPLWKDEQMAIVRGVGYEDPNHSHFRSIEIWETASNSNEYLSEGWLARVFKDQIMPADLVAHGIIIGRGSEGPLQGTQMRNVVMQNPQRFLRQARRSANHQTDTNNPALQHILNVQQQIHQAADKLETRLQSTDKLAGRFPKTAIGHQLHQAARLVAARVPVAVIKVSHGSFDTHSNQKNQHNRLLTQLSDAISAFRDVMREQQVWDRVLLMTYAEFGRRVAENGSRGTDHGTAAAHFLIGGKVKGGLYGHQPSLSDLQAGDLKYSIDFRSLYTTVSQNWFGVPMSYPGVPGIACIKT